MVGVAGMMPRLMELLGRSDYTILNPVIRVIGNVVTGSEDQTQLVVDYNGVIHLKTLAGMKVSPNV